MDIPRTLLLRERFVWTGKYSGYDGLCGEIIKGREKSCMSLWKKHGRSGLPGRDRVLSFFAEKLMSSTYYGPNSLALELAASINALFLSPRLIHMTYLENMLGVLAYRRMRISSRLVATAHQPPGWWKAVYKNPYRLANLDAVIALSRKQAAFFEEYIPGRVHFIPHGVNTEFFTPRVGPENPEKKKSPPNFLFVGKYLRDWNTLSAVIEEVLKKEPHGRFDIVVPGFSRNFKDPAFVRTARHDRVFWHSQLSDLRLRGLYQEATAFILPLLDATANTALTEAIACGLPIVSNDIGGVPDYTDPGFADLLPPGDARGMAQALLKLAGDGRVAEARGIAAREYAQKYLSWDKVAARTLKLYQKIA